MARHVNIPIFIPHEGCKNECIFCNQRTITGSQGGSDRDITEEIENALSTIQDTAEVEIAFFGGSFTGIGTDKMTRLCDTAYSYVRAGRVKSIRLSTRPDYIDDQILEILKNRGVTHIELGVQSMNDDVLSLCKRGHTAQQTEKACKMINDYGFTLGCQMMIGLYGSTLEDELLTARKIVEMGAREARIYPTVVFYDTQLCVLSQNGIYSPLSLEQAVQRSERVYRILKDAGIKVLRIGLQASENLDSHDKVYDGANHPSLGELVLGEYYYNNILKKEQQIKSIAQKTPCRLIIYCNDRDVSKISGQHKINKTRLLTAFEKYGYRDIKILGYSDIGEEKVFFSSENINEKRRNI